MSIRQLALTCALGALFSGCAANEGTQKMATPRSGDAGINSGNSCRGSNDCPPGQFCNAFRICSKRPATGDGGLGDAGLPPEVEERVDQPATGKRFVYVAIADQNMVVKIDSTDLKVRTVKVGGNPGALQTIGGQDVAIVLNRNDASATLLRSKTDGSDTIVTLPTATGLNQLAVSSRGDYALAYYDVSRSGGAIAPKQTFQEATLFVLAPGKERAINLTIGFRPWDVQFSADGLTAFVITQQGVSVVDLPKTTKPTIVPTISVFKDPLNEKDPTEVTVTSDGKYALVRMPALKGVRVVALATGTINDIDLGAAPTDIDLTPDGKLALVVLRSSSEIVFVDLPSDLTDPNGIERIKTAYTLGQATLTDDGKQALLFSNALAQEVLVVADLIARKTRVFSLKKGVAAVRPAPGSRTAIVIHNKAPGTPSASDPFETRIDKHQAYSLVNLNTGFVKLQLSDAPPGQTAFSTDGKRGYLLLADRQHNVRSLEAINLESFLVTDVRLGSQPVALGVVPSTAQIYVAQSHPLGRVTFVDEKTHRTRTLTGFALNSQVIE